jgi:general secretion pathway protein G
MGRLAERRPATRRKRKRQRGTSLLELLVVTALILIFITITIGRVWQLRAAAERTNIEQLIGTLKRALGTELAVSAIRRDSPLELVAYHHANPIALLERPPENYLGEFDTAPEQQVAGAWYFNRREGTLNYRVRFSDDFVGSNPDDPLLIRIQIRLDFDDRNRNGRYDPAIDTPRSLTLISLDDYRWQAAADEEG